MSINVDPITPNVYASNDGEEQKHCTLRQRRVRKKIDRSFFWGKNKD